MYICFKLKILIMEAKYFNKLMAELKNDDEIHCIAFKSKYQNYEMSFYGDENDVLIVEDFGFMKRHNWNQLEPTKMQLNKLQVKIDERRESLNNKQNEPEPTYYPDYDIYGNER